MAYCDYSFYINSYMGNVVAEADFPRLSERASEKLNELTFDRIDIDDDGYIIICNASGGKMIADAKLSKKIMTATCALAELFCDIAQAESSIRSAGGVGVKSVSSGSESISYDASSAILDKKVQSTLFYKTAKSYLAGTGLLYAGM